jgi:putative DNA primase/helicase
VNECREAALACAELGYYIVPLHGVNSGGCTCKKRDRCERAGKHPRVKNWLDRATKDEEAITAWFDRWPDMNYGIKTGQESGLVIYDVDPRNGGDARLLADHPTGAVVSTPGGGEHHYYRPPRGGHRVPSGKFAKGIDRLSDGRLAVGPSSRGPNGTYRLKGDSARFKPALLPEALLKGAQSTRRPTALPTRFELGERDDSLTSAAGTMRRRGMTDSEMLAALRVMNSERCTPPLSDRDLRRIAKSVSRYEPADNEHFTDLGNARRFVLQHGHNVRYVHQWNRWIIWNRQRWVRDDTGEALRLAKDVVRHMYEDAASIDDGDLRKKAVSWALRSEAEARLHAMLSLAQSERTVAILPNALDTDLWRLNVENGILELRTGVLRPHDPSQLMAHLVPIAYRPGARAPRWRRFLREVLPDAETVRFMQRVIGYCLTGDISERCLFILYGTGSNGKTTLIELLRKLLGSYAQAAEATTFLAKRNDGINNDVARLAGARFVSAMEVAQNRRLSEALVKQVTGGDMLVARFLHKEFFEFRPAFKVFIGTNHKPVIKGTDNAIWNRIRLIPFERTFERDETLADQLAAELPGILSWAVEGCLAWQRDGLGAPTAVDVAGRSYRDEQDVLRTFFADRCREGPNAKVLASDIYQAYKGWAKDNGEEVLNATVFGIQMTERGYVRYRSKKGRGYRGVRLKRARW